MLYTLKHRIYLASILSLLPIGFAYADMQSIVSHIESKVDQKEYKEAVHEAEKNKTHHTEMEVMIDEITQKAKVNENEYTASVAVAETKVKDYQCFAEKIVKEIEENSKKYAESKANSDSIVDQWIKDYQVIKEYKEDEKEGLYIFVSFSMPASQIIKLSEVAQKVGGRLVIRGLKDNSFKETIKFIKEIKQDGIPIDIDPVAFAKFNVSLVPAIVVSDKEKTDIITGNVSLSYALKQFIEHGDTALLSKEYLKRLGNEE